MCFDISKCDRDEKGMAMVTHNTHGDCVLICDTPSSDGMYFIEHPTIRGYMVKGENLTPRRRATKLVLPEKVYVRIFYGKDGAMSVSGVRPLGECRSSDNHTDHVFDPRLVPVDELIAAGSPWPDSYSLGGFCLRKRGEHVEMTRHGNMVYTTFAAAHLAASELHRANNTK